jgi:hypothetical protein
MRSTGRGSIHPGRPRLARALAIPVLLVLLGTASAVPVAAAAGDRAVTLAGDPAGSATLMEGHAAGDDAARSMPPTASSATAADADRGPTAFGAVAFILLALAVAVTTPVLAIRRRRTR